MDLTLINCNIQFGEKAWINIEPGRTLTLENCTLDVCSTEMWRGIVLDKKGSTNSPKVHLKDCIINNAELATYLTRDAIYQLEGCTFYDNYKDVLIENYPTTVTTAMQSNGEYTISGCLFTSNGGNLMSPYNASHKFAAIELNDVESVRIGVVGNAPNIFEKSAYGIKLQNSGAEIWNNEFDDLIYTSSQPSVLADGSGIYLLNEHLLWDRTLTVGKSSGGVSNIFTNCSNGIYGEGEANYTIYKNRFGANNTNAANRITNNAIFLTNFFDKTVDIDHGNLFYDYLFGIQLYKFSKNASIEIKNNNFFDAYLQSGVDFNGTAILMNNKIPVNKINNGYIYNNEIGSTAASHYMPRIGIHLGNSGGFRIEENQIHFHVGAIPADVYRGIRLEYSPECLVRGNTITNHLTGSLPGFNNILTAIRVDFSAFTNIKCNTITNVGYCMDFQGENSYVPMADNSMNSYNLGINLGFMNGSSVYPANIGNQQGNPSTGFGNTWNDQTSDRAEGFLTQIQIPWYHHNAVDFSNEECPLPSSGVQNAIILPIGNRTGYLEFPCFIDDPILINARAIAYCDIIADTVRYESSFAEDLHYARQNALYSFLKTDSARIFSGEEEDDAYSAYFNELTEMNLGKFYSVIEYINSGAFDLGMELVQTIDDTCLQEEYLKTVLIIELNALMTNDIYSAEDSSVLREIAYANSLNAGLATKIARAMLNLELEDAGEGGSRQMKDSIIAKYYYSIQPVPAKDYLVLVTNNTKILSYKIYDMLGSIVKTGERNAEPINIASLAPGVYTLVLFPENDQQISLKFIKLK